MLLRLRTLFPLLPLISALSAQAQTPAAKPPLPRRQVRAATSRKMPVVVLPVASLPPVIDADSIRDKEIMIEKIRADGSISRLNWKTEYVPFPEGESVIQLKVYFAERGGHAQFVPPQGSTWNRESGVLTLPMTRPVVEIPRGEDRLRISIRNPQPLVYTDIRCAKRRIHFGTLSSGKSAPMYLHFSCKPITLDRVEVTVSYSEDYRAESPHGLNPFNVSSGSSNFQISTRRLQNTDDLRAADFTLRSAETPEENLHVEVVLQGPNRWWFDASAGLSFLNYIQPNQGISLNQFAITGKVGVLFAIKPKKWDLLFSVYSTLLPIPLLSQPADLPKTWFLGSNLRLGYHVGEAFRPMNWKFRLYGGVYTWSMLGQNSYGLPLLYGPQVFIFMEHAPWKNGNMSFNYVKLGLLAESLSSLSFRNGEIAVGGGYAFPLFGKQFSAAIDVARASIQSADRAILIQLLSVSGGLQMNFHF